MITQLVEIVSSGVLAMLSIFIVMSLISRNPYSWRWIIAYWIMVMIKNITMLCIV